MSRTLIFKFILGGKNLVGCRLLLSEVFEKLKILKWKHVVGGDV